MSIKKKIVVVKLPFNEALEQSALQNFNKDVREGRRLKSDWKTRQTEYTSEARAILLRDGENRLPTLPDIDHFCVRARA